MHRVQRSAEPEFFEAIRCRYNGWGELYGSAGQQIRGCRGRQPEPCCRAYLSGLDGEAIRRAIRDALRVDFSGICGYCEQDCDSMITVIEHFRPRRAFPDEWSAWLNLVYACERCDVQKGDKWPGEPGDLDSSYSYINPSSVPGQRPAEEFFEYYISVGGTDEYEGNSAEPVQGQMTASADLSPSEWWQANRTIEDLDLNSDYELVDDRLPDQRTDQLDYVIDEIGDPWADMDRTAAVLREYAQPHQPFSSYVAAFARSLGIRVR